MEETLSGNMLHVMYLYRFRITVAGIMILISNALLILNPLILRQALFAISPQEQAQAGPLTLFFHELFGSHFQSIVVWSLLLLSVAIVSSVLKYWMRIVFLSVSRQVETDLRNRLFDRIQAQSGAFYDRHAIGDLLSRLTNDITAYRDLLGPGLMYPMFFITMLIPALIALAYLSPSMALVSSLPIIFMYLINSFVKQPLFKVSGEVQKSLADMSRMSHEYFSGIKLIKSYGVEEQTLGRFKDLCRKSGLLNIRYSTFQGMLFPGLVLVTKIITVLLVAMAAVIVLLKEGKTLSLGDFISFMWIQSYVFTPLLMLAWVIPMYQKGKASYARLFEIYNEPIEVREEPISHSSIHPEADIVFRNLTFSYPDQNRPVLSDLNLSIKAGTFFGITGPVGSGKTTLFRLLNREYEVPENKILFGDSDIHYYSLDAFRQNMVIVEQKPFLFSKSIRDNIRFGKEGATEKEIVEVSEEADLHQDVLTFPDQYNTIVGEKGVALSGGQKQRVAIARVFLADRSIFLLDDVFSAVDSATEKKIFAAIRKKFAGKTVLLITHRVSVLEKMDRVIYLLNGKIVADGSPQELVREEGPYRTLVSLQHKIDQV